MNFKIKYHKLVAAIDIPELPRTIKQQVRDAIERKLVLAPDKFGKPLRRSLKGYRKLRAGDYRIVFRISGHTVFILAIQHRKKVYFKIHNRMLVL